MKGFIDLQVNGYLGIDFSQKGLTLEQVRFTVFSLVKRGTIAFCPTIITSSPDLYRENLPVLAQAMEDELLKPHLLGIHLEGPFISPRDGARGAHDILAVTHPEIDYFEELLEIARGNVSIVTLAPEVDGAPELIRHLSKKGILVSLGHHLADARQIRAACEAGARAVTHLGNGIPNLLPRHPNPIWDQLAEEGLQISLISDGHHLPDSFLRCVIRAAGVGRTYIVSDSAPIGGFPPGEYETLGQTVRLEDNGRLWNPIGNHLVGSSSCMLECMNYLASLELLSEEELWAVGYSNPLKVLGKTLDESAFEPLPDLSFEEGLFRFS